MWAELKLRRLFLLLVAFRYCNDDERSLFSKLLNICNIVMASFSQEFAPENKRHSISHGFAYLKFAASEGYGFIFTTQKT